MLPSLPLLYIKFIDTLHTQLEAYPEAEFVHSKLRFPQTRNGAEIFQNEDYKKRIELVEGPTFPSLEAEYGDILEFYGFNQFLMYDDNKQSWSSKNKNEPLKGGMLTMMNNTSKMECTERFLCAFVVLLSTIN